MRQGCAVWIGWAVQGRVRYGWSEMVQGSMRGRVSCGGMDQVVRDVLYVLDCAAMMLRRRLCGCTVETGWTHVAGSGYAEHAGPDLKLANITEDARYRARRAASARCEHCLHAARLCVHGEKRLACRPFEILKLG